MSKKAPAALVASVLAIGLYSAPASALNGRSFISANGADTNPCTRASPCRTLQKAHDSTSANGEINVLDPAGYGVVIITKSISIVNEGVGSAGVLVPAGGTGLTINAAESDEVNVRGLIIEGSGVGQTGIQFTTGKSLTIANCVVRNMTHSGIALAPLNDARMVVSDTVVAKNGAYGIFVQPLGSSHTTVRAVFNKVEAYNNTLAGIGLLGNLATSQSTIRAIAVDSIVSHNNETGFYAVGNPATLLFEVHRSVARYNGGLNSDDIKAGPYSQIYVGGSSVGNWTSENGGIVLSFGDNYAFGPPPQGLIQKQ